MCRKISVKEHYDYLIRIGDDPFRDDELTRKYMDRWTGENFFDLLELSKQKQVLEIGVGTVRLAKIVLEKGCKSFTGIDISKDTLKRTEVNLSNFKNIIFLNDDVVMHAFTEKYDVVYSALTFMHISNKYDVLAKIKEILKPNGVMVISFFNVIDEYLDFGLHKVELFPNKIDEILEALKALDLEVEIVEELKEGHELLSTIIKARNIM